MKHSLSQFLFGLKSASAPLRSDFGTLRVKAKLKLPNHNEIITKTVMCKLKKTSNEKI
tara:strand:+ start:1702 stop:1875 length:174 start_codon:yes stop_codon:yes gene_type:complete